MNLKKTSQLLGCLILSILFFQMAEAKRSDSIKEEINKACATDAATSGCEGKKVGTGLLKCLRAYKKAHKDFKFSESCKAARKK